MRTYRSNAGPLRERPYYALSEIEDICTAELRGAGLYPQKPEAIRIERFIEKRFNVHPEFEELPRGLLGYSTFGPKGVERIVVARALPETGTRVAERQINTTLAHEAGHVLLQSHLFALEGNKLTSLFGAELDPRAPKILCRDPSQPGRGYDGRWWEFQANQAIGGLLLPRPLATEAVSDLLVRPGSLGRPTLEASKAELAARQLAEIFDVNPAVARIRLKDLFPELVTGQLSL